MQNNNKMVPPEFKCQHCEFRAESESDLQRHSDSEHDFILCDCCQSVVGVINKRLLKPPAEKPRFFRCSECDFYAESKAEVKEHLRIVHGNVQLCLGALFRCGECGFFDEKRASVGKHCKLAHNSNRESLVRCEFCDFYSEDKLLVLKHGEEKHGLRRLNCDQCGRSYKNREKLHSHLLKHHINWQSLKVENNPVVRNNEVVVKDRILVRKRPVFRCADCDFCSTDKREVGEHILTEHEERFRCRKCGEAFADLSALNGHSLLAHADHSLVVNGVENLPIFEDDDDDDEHDEEVSAENFEDDENSDEVESSLGDDDFGLSDFEDENYPGGSQVIYTG